MEPGEAFPAGTFNNLNPRGPDTIDLGADLGSRPVVLYYWIAGHRRADRVFRELEELSLDLGPDRLAFYGISVPREGLATAPAIRNHLQMMGLKTPVIEDTGFVIGKRLGASRVPHISIIDASGRLRLSNGASLVQSVSAGENLGEVIRQAAARTELPSYGELDRYFPVKELEGRPSPDFRAPLLATQVEQSWRGMLDDEKLNVLVFWSVDCPHCREELPEINAWLRRNPGGVNLVSCASAPDPKVKAKTLQFCNSNDFVFPTLLDIDAEIAHLYGITSTPTTVVIGPDGVVDIAIVTHGHGGESEGFGAMIERRKRELLPAS